MPMYMELVAELSASGFANSGQVATCKITKVIPDGPFRCQVEEWIKGVPQPEGDFETVEDAQAAAMVFWEQCDQALKRSGMPSWQKRMR